jgi:hypothetical protein
VKFARRNPQFYRVFVLYGTAKQSRRGTPASGQLHNTVAFVFFFYLVHF